MKLTVALTLLALALLSASSLGDDQAERGVPAAPGWSFRSSFWGLVDKAGGIFKPQTAPDTPPRKPVVPGHSAARVDTSDSESETDSPDTSGSPSDPAPANARIGLAQALQPATALRAANGSIALSGENLNAAASQPAGSDAALAAGAPPAGSSKAAAGASVAKKQSSTFKLLGGIAALFVVIVAAVFVLQRRFPAHPILACCGTVSKATRQSSEYTLAGAPEPQPGQCREIV